MAAVERSLDLQLREAGAVITHEPMPVVLADPLQLEQVVANLVSNAIKFRRPDVPLRIHVGARRTERLLGVLGRATTASGSSRSPSRRSS